MNGKATKRWFKSKPRPTKDMVEEAKSYLSWRKPVDRAVKFAKRALREMRKADPDQDGCGLWYERCGGPYRELCLAGGYCRGDQSEDCPYKHLKMFIKLMGGTCR